jgi:hypothetical protein
MIPTVVQGSDQTAMPNTSVIIHSFNMDGDVRCVDVFRRPDGTFGFEEYRRDPEDGRGWFPIGAYSSRSFGSASDAVENAKWSVRWLALTLDA